MSLMSPPCTILLRINGGFERISDACVIENGDHLHYEKPVGSVIVLEEATHKVLYIMNKEDVCSSALEADESNANQENNYCHTEVNLSDVASQQDLCTCNKANCINHQNNCEQQQPKLNIEHCALKNKTRNGLIDNEHAINLNSEGSKNIQKLALDDKSLSMNLKERNCIQSSSHNKSVSKSTNERIDNVHEDSNNDYLKANDSSFNSIQKGGNLLCNQSAIQKDVVHECENQLSNQLSTSFAEVHTKEDKNEKQFIENENCSQLGTMNSDHNLNDKKSGHDNKTIMDSLNGIESKKRLIKQPILSTNNFSSAANNDHQINETVRGENSEALKEGTNATTTDQKEISTSCKLKMPPTMSMASLTSSLDLGSNWTRPLRRRSTMSTIISTTSCSTNTANASSSLNKLQSGNSRSSSLLQKCRLSSQKTLPANLEGSGDNCIDKLRPDKVRSNEMEVKEGHQDKIQFRAHKGAPSELDIEEKILQRREMAHLFKWYYPEGGWGWVVLCAAMFSQAICHGGLQLGFSYPFGVIIRKYFGAIKEQSRREELLYSIDSDASTISELIEGNNHEALTSINGTSKLVKGVDSSSEDYLSQLQIGKKINIFSIYFLSTDMFNDSE